MFRKNYSIRQTDIIFFSYSYFTVTMLNMFTIYYDSHEIIDFPQSSMGRNLLKVQVIYDFYSLTLPTTQSDYSHQGTHGSYET